MIDCLKSIFVFILIQSCNSQTTIYNINIYKNTPVWELAKVVEEENILAIKEIIKKDSNTVFFPTMYDPTFKRLPSLLVWSIANNKYESFKVLLDHGSDPNFLTLKKKSPLMYSSDYIGGGNLINIEHIKALINKGADPTYIRQGYIDNDGNTISGESPLTIACQTGNLPLVKLLIENGANCDSIIYTPQGKNKTFSKSSGLIEALSFGRMDVLKYLIIEIKGDIHKSFGTNIRGEDIDINYYLRNLLFLKNSKEYQTKQEIINFVEKEGVNYRRSIISKRAINYAKANYPNTWEEYLKEY